MENLPKALVGLYLLRWIATYPPDKVICSLNNWDLADKTYWLEYVHCIFFIHWIVIYSMDRVIHSLNNRGLV